MTSKIYTKTGDSGETGLWGGKRVRKDDARIEALGTLDELNAALGVVRALSPPASLDVLLARMQNQLFTLGASFDNANGALCAHDVTELEDAIDVVNAELPPLREFILPAGTALAAALHNCRTVCRRAERRWVSLYHDDTSGGRLGLMYLNRLADLLFVLARQANWLANVGDALWQRRH